MSNKIDITEDGGVFKEILVNAPDDAPSPKQGQNVFVLYEGRLLDGKVFDSSLNKSNPFSFKLGEGQVIRGWDIGVQSMKQGEKAQFTLSPEYAYGESGAGGAIPPNATLVFDIELLSFTDGIKSKHDMSKEDKINLATTRKNEGNEEVKNKNYQSALNKFEEALGYVKSEIKSLNEEETTLYCACLVNIAICANKTGAYSRAISAASDAIKTKITSKAVYQRGLAYAYYASDDESLQLANEDAEALKKLVGENDAGYQNLTQTIISKKEQIIKSKKSLYKNFLNAGVYADQAVPTNLSVTSLGSKPDPNNPIVFMDLKYGNNTEPKRVEFELFKNHTPKTAENFRALCTGEKGITYKNNIFHRIIKGFMMQGGDYENRNGTGGKSIYGAKFEDENFNIKHTCEGLLSMANSGKNTNGSQFFITFKDTPWLDGKHVVFGRVIKGLEVVKDIEENVKLDSDDKPIDEVTIVDCGQL